MENVAQLQLTATVMMLVLAHALLAVPLTH